MGASRHWRNLSYKVAMSWLPYSLGPPITCRVRRQRSKCLEEYRIKHTRHERTMCRALNVEAFPLAVMLCFWQELIARIQANVGCDSTNLVEGDFTSDILRDITGSADEHVGSCEPVSVSSLEKDTIVLETLPYTAPHRWSRSQSSSMTFRSTLSRSSCTSQ